MGFIFTFLALFLCLLCGFVGIHYLHIRSNNEVRHKLVELEAKMAQLGDGPKSPDLMEQIIARQFGIDSGQGQYEPQFNEYEDA